MVHQLPPLKSAPAAFVNILRTRPGFAQEPLRMEMRKRTLLSSISGLVTAKSNSPPWCNLHLNAQGVQTLTRRDKQPEPCNHQAGFVIGRAIIMFPFSKSFKILVICGWIMIWFLSFVGEFASLSWREPAEDAAYSIWWRGTSSPPFGGRRGTHRCDVSNHPWKVFFLKFRNRFSFHSALSMHFVRSPSDSQFGESWGKESLWDWMQHWCPISWSLLSGLSDPRIDL